MGLITSRRAMVEEVDTSNNNAYRYPPKTGTYFGSYFIMGGNRFESTQPDSYLFGENKDLNFIGARPTPFPYPPPQAHEPTRTLKSLVNIRKDSLKFVKDTEQEAPHPPNADTPSPAIEVSNMRYNIEFTFDSDAKCAITIYYFAVEEIINKQLVYRPRDPSMNSETVHYKRGANQVFSQPTHFISPDQFTEEEWSYSSCGEAIPVVIHCVVEEDDHVGHSHSTLAIVDKSADGGFTLKAFKQKQIVDGLCYLLQEIYGIENKNTERAKLDEDFDDNGSECVICMSETRDTLILPCRHLCLCNGCADNLRYQASNCPICRSKFRALLQIRAMRKKPTGQLAVTRRQPESGDEIGPSQEGIPPGYEAVSLIEALNGPTLPQRALNMPTDGTTQSLANRTNAAGMAATSEIGSPIYETISGDEAVSKTADSPGDKESGDDLEPSSTRTTPVALKRTTVPNITLSLSSDSGDDKCEDMDAEVVSGGVREERGATMSSDDEMGNMAKGSNCSSVEIITEISPMSVSSAGSSPKVGSVRSSRPNVNLVSKEDSEEVQLEGSDLDVDDEQHRISVVDHTQLTDNSVTGSTSPASKANVQLRPEKSTSLSVTSTNPLRGVSELSADGSRYSSSSSSKELLDDEKMELEV